MKVLIVSQHQGARCGLKMLLEKSKMSVEEFIVPSLEIFLREFPEKIRDCGAIIFDRFHFPISIFQSLLNAKDCFFVIEKYEDVQSYGKVDSDFTFRFYFWPLNYTLILDDIKSICRLKEYMDFGEIDLTDVILSLNKRALVKGNTEVSLKNKEFELLLYLAKNRGKVLSRNNILENVWDMNSNILTNTVDVHVSKIRRILKINFGIDELIKTIPCSGYILRSSMSK